MCLLIFSLTGVFGVTFDDGIDDISGPLDITIPRSASAAISRLSDSYEIHASSFSVCFVATSSICVSIFRFLLGVLLMAAEADLFWGAFRVGVHAESSA